MDCFEKAQIIVEFAEKFSSEGKFKDFFTYNDLGVPLATSFVNDLIELKRGGINVIDETYAGICELFDGDEEIDYENLEDLMSN